MAEDVSSENRPLNPRQAGRPVDALLRDPPALLAQFFNNEIDLDRELAARYSAMPLMSLASFRASTGRARHGVATLSTQDGAAGLRVETDATARTATFVFTLGSMIGVSFAPSRMADVDRAAFLNAIRSGDEAAFLWGASRWEQDYLIFTAQKYATHVFAFSPRQVEGAARLTSDVSARLIDWLERMWR